MSDSPITQRKQDHIDWLLQDEKIERRQSGFDQIQLTHRGLPECDYAQIDSSAAFLDYTLNFPLLISSMTGGASNNLNTINENLARAAEHCQVAMAVGSQRTMILDNKAEQSFQLRQFAPTVPLIANMGAIQLNYGFGYDEAQKMVETLEADALYLHLNPLQEVIQPEGDTNFAKLAEKIAHLKQQLSVPIILKEVGCGLSSKDIQLGLDAGIDWFDLAGRGGTSWSRIEAHRADNTQQADLGKTFQDWGLTTPQALKQVRPFQSHAQFIASGGIRNGIDMVKSVIMGAQICGVAAPLLKPAMTSTNVTIETIEQLQQEFRTAQFLLGMPKLADLFLNDSLIVP
ncbi:type 2 isopentenyl-diphosphate Delta-isomerase [Hydrogenovibrio sp. 3SP14C1]|uniref:type 2 isopentenyl-diphosphate Delta-isomerase n=1 Tax=Hydrogenovibrio sp. 3SP14C1 TaxID=3038774 RepID=UPI00241801A6|nr:type 2 isopentenyl-diphosphate Delta-isomerase [Hydrogenovibrio sp. 3SP14C1]MDG4812285.1 type 2 isopentenyl-diphosphate Delta-isomerase [Hydrogenovibrio sp. 3SP14C1]